MQHEAEFFPVTEQGYGEDSPPTKGKPEVVVALKKVRWDSCSEQG